MLQSTDNSTGNPQGTNRSPDYCRDCGASVYWQSVRLTGGTYRMLPVDMVPWTGSRVHLRLERDHEGRWYVEPRSGRWQEHLCGLL